MRRRVPNRPERPYKSAADVSAAFLNSIFDAQDRDQKIAAQVRGLCQAADPAAANAKLEAETAGELLAFYRLELRRCIELKQRCDLLTERHYGKRKVPLTRHVRLKYLVMMGGTFTGIIVGTWALAAYAANSGVVAAMDGNPLAATTLAFPAIGTSLMLKAAGGLFKDDAAKRRFYSWLTKLGSGFAIIFGLAAAFAFAPHTVDVSAIQDALTTGGSTEKGVVAACAAAAPYAVVGSGLLIEILAAAVIAHRADQLNELGRDAFQGISPTQLILDDRIGALQAKIEAQAKKTAALQVAADLHEATIAESIEAAQAHARTMEAQYAAYQARSRQDFLAAYAKKDI